MLQGNRTQSAASDIQPFGAEQQGLPEFIDWVVGLLRRQYLVILLVALLSIGAGVIYLRIATPAYTAQASLVVDLHRNPIVQQEGIFNNDPIEIESQVQIIKSDAVATAVIQKLQLMNDPEFSSTEGFISHLIGLSHPKQATDPIRGIIANFGSRLTVEQAGGRVITIKYISKDPDRSAQIANAVANAYITDQLDSKYEASRIASNWLQERQRQLREQAETAERAVDAFKKQNNIVTTDGKPIDDQQIVELNTRLITTRAQESDLSARLEKLQAVIRLGPSNPKLDGAIADVNNPIMVTLRQQYLELARRESEWSARYGHDHLAVVNLRSRMQEIRQSIFDELQRAYETAKIDYDSSKQRQKDIKTQLENTVAQSRTASAPLRELETTAATYRDRYKAFLQQYTGATQQETFPITEARLISPASPLTVKIKPQPLLILALSIIGGIGFGFGLAILRDAMDRVFRTERQLEAELQIPCIAVVPLLKGRQEKPSMRDITSIGGKNTKNASASDSDVFWTVVNSPLSNFSEAIRSIKLAVDLNPGAESCKVIGFTSTVPNEGKSTLAAALAQLISQANGRVLLVDCDLRNPTLSRILAPNATIGIVDVVSGKNSAAEAILREPKTNMAILPTGKKIPLFLTSEILSGDAMSVLFNALRKNYNYIIVDLPPLAPIVDVRAATHLFDLGVLAVAWGQTKIDVVEQALKNAPMVYDRLIGTVLNKTDMDFIRRYDMGGRYDYNKHYARYGYTE